MRRYLIVGNQTLASDQLAEKVQDVLAAGPAKLHLVVPATPAHERLTWTEGAAHEAAERSLEAAVALFSALGAEVDGEVGDADAMEAVRDLRGQSFDEIILSTLPSGLSQWMKQDLPYRVRREFGLPVWHVVGDSPPSTPPHADTRSGEAVVHLDVEGGHPDAPEVQGLVREVAARTFASMPNLEELVVRARSGRFPGSSQRPHPAPAPLGGLDPLLAPFPLHPFDLHSPPSEHVEVASLMDARVPPPHLKQVFEDTVRPKRPLLAERLHLPSDVRSKLWNPDDPVEIVRALLEAAGLPVRVQDEVVLSQGHAIVVLRTGFGDPVSPAMLNHAYRRFIQSGASRGVVALTWIHALPRRAPPGTPRPDAGSLGSRGTTAHGGRGVARRESDELRSSPCARRMASGPGRNRGRKRFKGHVQVSSIFSLKGATGDELPQRPGPQRPRSQRGGPQACEPHRP